MASLAYDNGALEDLDRLSEAALLLIQGAIVALERHPLLGRRVEGDLRELVISQGRTGYIALYHYRKAADHIQVRAVRHQREAGFDD